MSEPARRRVIREIRSGGQTGVDRAALDVALQENVPYAGWCPRGGWAEDFPEPPGVRALFPQLVETPSTDPNQRTGWNVRDADATLIFTRAGIDSPGTEFTLHCAEVTYTKPHLLIELNDERSSRAAADWLVQVSGLIALNIAGPRESEAPGIYHQTVAFLRNLLQGN